MPIGGYMFQVKQGKVVKSDAAELNFIQTLASKSGHERDLIQLKKTIAVLRDPASAVHDYEEAYKGLKEEVNREMTDYIAKQVSLGADVERAQEMAEKSFAPILAAKVKMLKELYGVEQTKEALKHSKANL